MAQTVLRTEDIDRFYDHVRKPRFLESIAKVHRPQDSFSLDKGVRLPQGISESRFFGELSKSIEEIRTTTQTRTESSIGAWI